MSDSTVKCKLCKCLMYGNKARHLRGKHCEEYMQYRKHVKSMRTVTNTEDSDTSDSEDKGEETEVQTENDDPICSDSELEEKPKSFCAKSVSGRHSNFSWIKKYSIEVVKNIQQCKICKAIVKVNGKVLFNMKIHFKRRHSRIFYNEQRRNKIQRNKVQRNAMKWVDKFSTEIKANIRECHICRKTIKVPYNSHSNLRRHFRVKHPMIFEKEEMQISKQDNYLIKEREEHEVQCINTINDKEDCTKIDTRDSGLPNEDKSSFEKKWVKKYSTEIEKQLFRCNLCQTTIKLSGYSFGNLKRHFRGKHPVIYEQEEGNSHQESSVIEDKDYANPNAEKCKVYSSEIKTQDSLVINDKLKSVKIWVKKYSTEVEKDTYQCHLCQRTIKLPGKIYSNLKRHFRGKHPVIYEKEEIKSSNQENNVVVDTGEYEILYFDSGSTEIVDENSSETANDSTNLEEVTSVIETKVKTVQAETEDPEQIERKNTISFQETYFDVKDDIAQCKICAESFAWHGKNQTPLFIHIQNNHPDEVILYEEDPLCNEMNE